MGERVDISRLNNVKILGVTVFGQFICVWTCRQRCCVLRTKSSSQAMRIFQAHGMAATGSIIQVIFNSVIVAKLTYAARVHCGALRRTTIVSDWKSSFVAAFARNLINFVVSFCMTNTTFYIVYYLIVQSLNITLDQGVTILR